MGDISKGVVGHSSPPKKYTNKDKTKKQDLFKTLSLQRMLIEQD
jgi:hypothetical protein